MRRSAPALAASPVLVGAVTVLVTIVAVFLSYNANTGLPFVPTYDLKANLPNASQLVEGFEVRIGGARVGQVSAIEPKQREDGSTYAQITMKLDKEIEPLPADSALLVRPRSALGLKYVELRPGSGRAGFRNGATIPIRRARPEVVEIDDLFNMFDEKARAGSRNSLDGYGEGLAGRGQDLNLALAELRPLLEDLEPVARNLADPETRLDRFFRELGDAAAEAAPVAETAGRPVREPRHHLHRAVVGRPPLPAGDDQRGAAHRGGGHPRLPAPAPLPEEQRRAVQGAAARAWPGCPRWRRCWPTPSRPAPRCCPRRRRSTSSWPTCSRSWPSSPAIRWCGRASTSSRGCRRRCARRSTSSHRPRRSATTRRSSSATSRACSPRGTPTAPGSASRSWPRPDGPNNEHRSLVGAGRRARAEATTCTATPIRTRPRPVRRGSARPATSAYVAGRTTIGNAAGQPGHTDPGPAPGRRRRRMRTARHGGRLTAFQVGLIGLVLVVVLGYLAFSKDIPFTRPFEVSAVFENAPPVRQGTAVRVAGVDVGKVSAVEPIGGDSPGVRVTMKLEDEALPIHENAEIKARQRIFLEGNLFMEVRPGTPDAGEMEDGATIPASQTSAAVQIDQVLGTLTTGTREDLQRLLEGYGEGLNGQPQPGEDDDQDPDVQGETGGRGAQRLARLLGRRPARHRGGEPGPAGHRAARPVEAGGRPAEGHAGVRQPRGAAQGPDHELQRDDGRAGLRGGQPPGHAARAPRGAGGGPARARQPQPGLPLHAGLGAGDDPGRPGDPGDDRGRLPLAAPGPRAGVPRRAAGPRRTTFSPRSTTSPSSSTARWTCCRCSTTSTAASTGSCCPAGRR